MEEGGGTSWEAAAGLFRNDDLEAIWTLCQQGVLQIGEEDISFSVNEEKIVVGIPSYGALAQMLQEDLIGPDSAQRLERLSHTLRKEGHTLEIRVGGRWLGTLGVGRTLGSIARLLRAAQTAKVITPSAVVTVREQKGLQWKSLGVATIAGGLLFALAAAFWHNSR